MPTASRFADIMTPNKMAMSASRKRYACEIIASRLLNWQPMNLDKLEHIERGREQEPLAVAQLELVRDIETKKIGFIQSADRRFGASPDRVAMKGDTVSITAECKCPSPAVQMEYLLQEELAVLEPKSRSADAYICQRQGQLYVAEAEEAIFFAFNANMPHCYVRNQRDEPFIRKLAASLDQFSDELETLFEKAKSLGDYIEFERWLSPAERDLGSSDADVQRAIDADYQWGAN